MIVILSLQDRFLGSTFHPLDCVVVDSRCDTNRGKQGRRSPGYSDAIIMIITMITDG